MLRLRELLPAATGRCSRLGGSPTVTEPLSAMGKSGVQGQVGRAYALSQSYFKLDFRTAADEEAPLPRRARFVTESRWPLDTNLPQSYGEVTAALPGELVARDYPPETALSALLHHGAGVHRYQAAEGVILGRRHHRGFSSPRAIYSSEVVLWLPRRSDRPEGLFHYDALRPDLGMVRSAPRRWLEAVVEMACEGVDAAVFVTSDFGRIGRNYTDFSYRLACLKAGTSCRT